MSVTLWMVLAGALGLAELLTGTFYLLALACGALGGALLAQFDFDLQTQLTATLALDVVGVYLCHRLRLHFEKTNGSSDALQNMDIGHQVSVTEWALDGRSAQVSYRGALWNAQLAQTPSSTPLPTPCLCRIVDIQGAVLMLEPVPTSHT